MNSKTMYTKQNDEKERNEEKKHKNLLQEAKAERKITRNEWIG